MGETYDAGTLTAELDLDASKLTKGVKEAKAGIEDVEKSAEHAGEALKTLAEIGEALGLAEAFHLIKEGASECLMEFDANSRSLRAMSAAVSEINADVFKEMAEGLASTSRNSVATEENTIALASRFGLTDEAIGGLLPTLNKFAEVTGQEMPGAMQRMAMAIESGQTSPRRLGLALTEAQKAAFATGDQATRVGILVEAMGDKMKGVGDTTETAGFAMAKMSNQTGEAMSAIGGLIDQPFAEFFSAVTVVVKMFTDAINEISPGLKEVMGYVAAGAIGLTSMGLAVGSAMTAWSALSGLLGPLGSVVLPAVNAGLTATLGRLAVLAAPITLLVAGFVGLATAYGVFKNALDGKVTSNVLEALKEGLDTAKADIGSFFDDLPKTIAVEAVVHIKLVPVVQGLDFGKEEKTPGFESKGAGDTFDKISEGLKKKGVDTSEVGKYASDRTTGADAGNGIMDFSTTLSEVAEQTHKAWQANVIATANGVASSFNATTDANADLNESIAKQKDAQLTAAAAVGGIWTQFMTGKSAPGAPLAAAAAPVTATNAGGALVQGASGGFGAVGGMASAFASGTASGGPIIGLIAAIGSLLTQSTSFMKIMQLVNQILTTVIQAINPILNAVIPALTVVLSMVGNAVKNLIGVLTPLITPIMKLITSVVLAIQPFIQLAIQIVDKLMPIITDILAPVFNALSTALTWLSKIIIEGVVNPMIDAWNAMIDAIDDILGWAGVDLSALKLSTVSLNTNADAVDAVTQSMNDLDQSSQNIPEGFKVALTAYNSGAVSTGGTSAPTPPAAPPTPPATGGLAGILSTFQTASSAQLASDEAAAPGAVFSRAGLTAAMSAMSGGSGGGGGQNKMMTMGGTVNIQTVTVQAATSDLIGQIQSSLKNLGYLKSGTPMIGATSRTQYGSA